MRVHNTSLQCKRRLICRSGALSIYEGREWVEGEGGLVCIARAEKKDVVFGRE